MNPMKRILNVRRPALWMAMAVLTSTASCDGGGSPGPANAGAAPPPPTGTQFVVAVDLSTSLTDSERANHAALLRALVSGLDFGDRLVLLKAHAAGIHDTSTIRTASMPVPRGPKPLRREKDALALARQTADLHVSALFKTPPVIGSDLFATLHTAGERARENPGTRTVLILLSDMLQCAGGVCMETGGAVPDSAWIDARRERGLMPPLDRVCVSVVGADASTEHGVNVRKFWRRYFQAAGASFSEARYVHGASSPAGLRC